jgi:hypothetical protein
LTEAEAAEALKISTSTLKREWGFAKSWLLREMSSAPRAHACNHAMETLNSKPSVERTQAQAL